MDTNILPRLSMQRVDVVTGGASAVYGSDADAGVVNYILDKRFEGVRAEVQDGISGHGDDKTWRTGIAAGTSLADGRLHIEGSCEHFSTLFRRNGRLVYGMPGAGTAAKRRYPQAVAVFAQGASGDQNPLFLRPLYNLPGVRSRTPCDSDDRICAVPPPKASAEELDASTQMAEALQSPIKPEEREASASAVTQIGEIVTAMGALIGESDIEVMKNHTAVTENRAKIWGGQDTFSCPGRERLDASAPQGVLPYIALINGEVYSDIALRLKHEAPVSQLSMTTLANGVANSGYIYSNEAGSHLTFQVIGSHLKPGYAEDAIVTKELALIQRSMGIE